MMSQNNPQSILITGASSGIGEALAIYYAGPNIFLALTGRDQRRLDSVAVHCRAKGAQVETAVISVTEREAMERWILSMDRMRPLSLVIANAGISGGTAGVMEGEPVEQVRTIFDVNLIGVLNTIGPIMPLMIARKTGQIALVSSMAGFRGFPGAPAYSASKGAVRFYGEALRGAIAGTGVKVNVICPGFIKSRMTDANKFKMPFLMEADKAAKIIAEGLQKNRGRIAFPLPVHAVSWFLSVLPDCLAQILLRKLPAKA